jgi:hypothetical protein
VPSTLREKNPLEISNTQKGHKSITNKSGQQGSDCGSWEPLDGNKRLENQIEIKYAATPTN